MAHSLLRVIHGNVLIYRCSTLCIKATSHPTCISQACPADLPYPVVQHPCGFSRVHLAGSSTLNHSVDIESTLFRRGCYVRAPTICSFITSLMTHSAFWIADIPRPLVPHEEPSSALDATLPSNLADSNTALIPVISSHPVWKCLAADIFLGQIIASLIVLKFVGVSLLHGCHRTPTWSIRGRRRSTAGG